MSNTNQDIENRAKKLGFNNSLSFLKNCSPDFDIHKSIETHKQTKSIIEYDDFQQYIETDDEIHELVCLLNKFRPTTSMSCQYDMYGYANISFTMTGFTFFTNILLKHAKLFISTKYPSLSNEEVSELVLNLNIIKRFIINNVHSNNENMSNTNKFSISCSIHSGEDSFSQRIIWQFLTADIRQITDDIKEIFNIQ